MFWAPNYHLKNFKSSFFIILEKNDGKNTYNDHHHEEYEMFAEQLQDAGKNESSEHIRKMIELTVKGNECLRKALKALD